MIRSRFELGAHAFDHVDRGALGGAVDGRARMRHQTRHGGSIDDVSAFAVPADARQHGDDAVDGAPQIDTHHPVPVGVRGENGRADDRNARIVAEQMDLAEARFRRIRGAREFGPVGHVQLERKDTSGRAELRRGSLQMVVADVSDDDIHASAQQRFGDAEADATRAAGHERGLAGQILHTVLIHYQQSAVSGLDHQGFRNATPRH